MLYNYILLIKNLDKEIKITLNNILVALLSVVRFLISDFSLLAKTNSVPYFKYADLQVVKKLYYILQK